MRMAKTCIRRREFSHVAVSRPARVCAKAEFSPPSRTATNECAVAYQDVDEIHRPHSDSAAQPYSRSIAEVQALMVSSTSSSSCAVET